MSILFWRTWAVRLYDVHIGISLFDCAPFLPQKIVSIIFETFRNTVRLVNFVCSEKIVDDACVLLHSTDDYSRLRHHLDRYRSVSNAKVNIHKTEVFSLDGRSYPEWIAFLVVQGISKWHDHSSPSPLRYLGFPLIQFFHQHRYLEQQLLQTVKSQCTIYSQRRLSIKVRVTIVNALILSKLWWARSFGSTNSTTQPTDMLASSNPGRQLPQSCSQPILLDHIRGFHSGNTGTRLALFSPLLRLRPAAHANNFMQNIYEAVDSFGYVDTQQAKCTPATLLRFPLSAIFAIIPTNYWITRSRHKNLRCLNLLRIITTLDVYGLYCHLTSLPLSPGFQVKPRYS
ncbi:hypothetical protein G6F35_003283 [Rhizopus arrhizus]|nr:hypothetical protein G6F35_003283 [Rhizopus arrhizus]